MASGHDTRQEVGVQTIRWPWLREQEGSDYVIQNVTVEHSGQAYCDMQAEVFLSLGKTDGEG